MFSNHNQIRMYSISQWICSLVILAFVVVTINATNNMTISTTIAIKAPIRCEDARLKCAYRTGCGRALQQYLTSCAAVFQGDSNICHESCQHALIALTSTDEGKELMTCECAKEDIMCLKTKERVEICRSSVNSAMNRTRVSCRIATWICNADALCSTALYYYNGFCKSMFHGKKCTHRCRNSIDILTRQEKAAKLNTCICDGAEDYDCKGIHYNMNLLCFGKILHEYNNVLLPDTRTNEVSGSKDVHTVGNYYLSRTNFIIGVLLILFMAKD
ncbi:hypothetical protein PV327_003645 [Microctonus hyperodae]|uniref:GDNF/GAS1 domain-containing protein n=1 Tax=Microctonus hyperodae TaxID=165561 RepID=A0AA39G4S7_MICHY|nr:hypothetical protein PV327_003645 [Microctonus hyperodae]